MGVKSLYRALGNSNLKLLTIIVVSLGAIFVLAAFITNKSDGQTLSKRVNIAVRAIGHDLLLRSGDSTSLVRPVIEKSNGVFLLQFENEFSFQPDTLIAIAQQVLDKTGLPGYTVTVYRCGKPEIVYGFEIQPLGKSITPCQGRTQSRSCYNIEIAFADFPMPGVSYFTMGLLIGGIPLALGLIFIGKNFLSEKSKPLIAQPNVNNENEINSSITLGRLVFSSTQQRLIFGDENILLTDKECKILVILYRNIGQLTMRDELIQNIWTNEGVITGRSLDMFISKLRKKISADPDLRITNVHGKGYKLEIIGSI